MTASRAGRRKVSKALLIHALLLATAFCWGMAFVFIKQALLALTPVELTVLRFGLAGLAFLLYLCLSPAARRPVARGDWGRFLLLGLLGVPAYHLALNFGEQWISASTASLIIAVNPLLTALLSALIARERPRWQSVAGILVALGGLLFVLRDQGGPASGASSGLGVVLVLGSAVSWAFYSVLAKPLFHRYPSATVTAYATLLGSAMLFPLLRPALLDKVVHLSTGTWGAVLFLSLLSAFFGYLAWYYALARREAAQVAVYLYLNPLFSVLGSRWLLREPLTFPLLAGGALILGGVVLSNRVSAQRMEDNVRKKVPLRAGNSRLA